MNELNELLANHYHQYDSDCSDDFGCSCGWESESQTRYEGVLHAEFTVHLAAVLTEAGYSNG